jgi:hypothetical protein
VAYNYGRTHLLSEVLKYIAWTHIGLPDEYKRLRVSSAPCVTKSKFSQISDESNWRKSLLLSALSLLSPDHGSLQRLMYLPPVNSSKIVVKLDAPSDLIPIYNGVLSGLCVQKHKGIVIICDYICVLIVSRIDCYA